MVIYVILAVILVLDLINPKILWYLDSWRYQGDKPDPSSAFLILHRAAAVLGLAALACVVYFRG